MNPKTDTQSVPQFSTDRVASCIFHSLLKDFRSLLGDPTFCLKAEKTFNSGIVEFRHFEWPKLGEIPIVRFKAWWQMRHLLKRHRFCNDAYTDEELEQRTIAAYKEHLITRGVYRGELVSTKLVLREARNIARDILGAFDDRSFLQYCAIGKRATLGGPLAKAYLDGKLGDPESFTCPSALRSWFYKIYIPTSPLMGQIVRSIFQKSKAAGKALNLRADFLKAVLVPKSWKTLRLITPLSLIGLFYSYWLGTLVTEKLASYGLNIKTLQELQKLFAKRGSKKGRIATVDLRSASDSIRSDHLNQVLPRAWYVALKKSFIRQITLGDRQYYTDVVLPMGNGATFPVETLYFYCLIKAIGNLLGVTGTYSVYGDDLIYPVRIHSYVRRVFADLGLGINEDKSFVDSSFRESCGGDFYHGVDVRPTMLPETPETALTRNGYAAYLYKIHNALTQRWDPSEIPETLRFLELELYSVQQVLLQVPLTFPDTSGLRTSVPRLSTWYRPLAQPKVVWCELLGYTQFYISLKVLERIKPSNRFIVDERPYYWDKLRSMECRRPDWRSLIGWSCARKNAPWVPSEATSSISLIDDPTKEERYFVSVEASKIVTKYKTKSSLITNWTQGVAVKAT